MEKRFGLANHETVYGKVMKYLSEEMRFCYASHSDTHEEVLMCLAEDPSQRVRFAVYCNVNTPTGVRYEIKV